MAHTIILPYFSEEEVDRYLKIVQLMDRLAAESECPSGNENNAKYEFLLAASPKIEPSKRLEEACKKVAPTHSFQCPTQIFGYPEGPTAMFWDAMDYVRDNLSDDCDGFALWLESDMAPVKPDWIDRLDAEWRSTEQTPVIMGCFVPKLYKRRMFRKERLMLDEHINGGACYNKQLSSIIPTEQKQECFDMVVYREGKKHGPCVRSEQIMFSTNERVRRDVINPNLVIVHGFMQEKDTFIDNCLRPISEAEKKNFAFNGVADTIENWRRQVRRMWIRRGRQAILDTMYTEKRKLSKAIASERKAA